MTAPIIPFRPIRRNLENLHRGLTYRVTTSRGIHRGEYLGIESPHGDRAILLRNAAGTASISLAALTSVHLAA